MSASQYDEFDRRMRRITRRHTKLSHGYVTSVNDDGLVVAKPRRKRRGTLRGVAIVVLVLMAFKGFLHSQLGADAYAERVTNLSNGSAFEKAGGVLMAADPITVWLSARISGFL